MKKFKNPILKGYYPDPSVCRVGEDYYLVNSSNAYFPGVPIFYSRDLVNWKQIGNVLNRESQLPLANAGVSRGIFAPTIRYHDGVFYMITTNVTSGGNFYVTTTDPAGEWSEPNYIINAPGIDPSLYFENGKCYYQGACEKVNGDYVGDNEIYLQELDLKENRLVGERFIIWHSAVRDAVWAESPHIFKKGEYYYLLTAEGGTEHDHAVVIARSRTLTGYYEGNRQNPILTHRHLGKDYPIANTGHGDMVKTHDGEWWMVVLGSRPYGGRYRNLGRETFLVPVSWEDEWPVVNYGIGLVQENERMPGIALECVNSCVTNDRKYIFTEMDKLPFEMMFLRNPVFDDFKLNKDGLKINLSKNKIIEHEPVSFLCFRQQHKSYELEAKFNFNPKDENEHVGICLFQNELYNYQFIVTRKENYERQIKLIKIENGNHTILSESNFPNDDVAKEVYFKIIAEEQMLSFYYSKDGEIYKIAIKNVDARILSTDVAGSFVGTTIGLYATSNGKESKNEAVFKNLLHKPLIVEA